MDNEEVQAEPKPNALDEWADRTTKSIKRSCEFLDLLMKAPKSEEEYLQKSDDLWAFFLEMSAERLRAAGYTVIPPRHANDS